MSRQIRNVICFALPITIGNVRIDFFQIDKEFTLRINLLLPPLSIKEMHRTLKINFISLSKSFEILSKYFWTKNFNLYRDLFPKERERKGGEETRDSINFHSFRNSSKKIDTIFPNDISSNDRPKFNLFFQKSKWEEEKRSNAVSGSLRRTSLPSMRRRDLIRRLFNLHAGARCNELSSQWKRDKKPMVVRPPPEFPFHIRIESRRSR